MRKKTLTVNCQSGWHLRAGGFADRRQDVAEVDNVLDNASLPDDAWPAHEAWNMIACVDHLSFRTDDFPERGVGDDGCVGSVVADKDQQSVVSNAGLFQLRVELADRLVDIRHHVSEKSLRIFVVAFVSSRAESLRIPVSGIRRRIEGAVCEDHWVVDQERLFAVLVDEVADKFGADIRAVFAIHVVPFFAV